MRRFLTVSCCIVPLVLCWVVAAPAQPKGAGFDFAKTREFMKEMEGRPDFPVGTVLANDYVYTMRTLGANIATARSKAIVSWIRQAQQKNGGFVSDSYSKEASLLYTDLALETLAGLNASDAVDAGSIKAFVLSLKNRDGGFGFSSQSRSSSLASTFFAVEILKRLQGLDLVDKEKTAAFVAAYRKKGGGFGASTGGSADARSSYMAVYVLRALGAMNEGTRRETVSYLKGTPYATGKKGSQQVALDEQLYAVKALRELDAAGRIDRKFVLAFLKRLYVPVNGGFGPIVGYGSSPDSTTAAVRTLAEIGMLRAPTGLTASSR